MLSELESGSRYLKMRRRLKIYPSVEGFASDCLILTFRKATVSANSEPSNNPLEKDFISAVFSDLRAAPFSARNNQGENYSKRIHENNARPRVTNFYV